MREKCPDTEFFWSVFSPNTGKYGPEKAPYLDTFHAVKTSIFAKYKKKTTKKTNKNIEIHQLRAKLKT